MKTAAVIAELNPLHNGHARLFDAARRSADTLIVVMSGDFVQRGTPAVFDKYVRAEMALRAGADVVLELPAAAAVSSAQHFAEGGCALLHALGVVDELWFGSESGDLSALERIAEILQQEPDPFRSVLAESLSAGLSFPAARQEAIAASADSETLVLLKQPNNILALEYLLALRKAHSRMRPHTIPRFGDYHEESLRPGFPSATALRRVLLSDPESAPDPSSSAPHGWSFADARTLPDPSADAPRGTLSAGFSKLSRLRKSIPEAVVPVYERALQEPVLQEDDFSDMLQYRLLCETDETLATYADVSPDLARRICRLLPQYVGYSSFAELLKSKNTTRAQINRALLHILLNLRNEDVMRTKHPSYARLLGIRDGAASAALLSGIKQNSRIPLLSGAADLPPQDASPDLFASRLYASVKARKAGTVLVAEASRRFLKVE